MNLDVLIAGAGPAGTSLAAACCERGLRVALLAPEPDARWAPTYGTWVDDVGPEVPLDVRWPDVSIHLAPGEVVRAGRAYARVDGEGLRVALRERATGLVVLRGSVVGTEAGASGSSVRDDRGRVHHASVVVTATGAGRAASWQTAHGLVAELDGLDPAAPRWMDFSQDFADDPTLPTFLYALPFPDGTWLVEETALVRSPEVGPARLAARLDQRLRALGVRVRRVLRTESVRIPMDAEVPAPGATLAFGAAAGMVHPATGYLLPRVLRTAPRVAEALAVGLGRDPGHAVALAREAIWPADASARHALLRYGSGVLARLGPEDTRAFFRAFFGSPTSFVHPFLAGTIAAPALVQGMAAMFARLPMRLRWRVVSAGHPGELVRAALSHRSLSSEARP